MTFDDIRRSSYRLLYPIGATFIIFLLLFDRARRANGDPNRLFTLFEIVSVLFFAALLFRQLLRPKIENISNADEPKQYLARLAFALAIGAVSYARTLPLFFVCDDFAHLDQMHQAFSVAVWPEFTNGQSATFYRPLGFLSIFLDARLWHNWIPGYHLTSVLLHVVCVAGVYFLCRELRLKGDICLAASVFFALSPVNVQTVTWTAARFDQLAAALGVWSIVYAARFRRSGDFKFCCLAMLLFVLAVLSKENAYVFPLLALALEMSSTEDVVKLSKRSAIYAGYFAAIALLMIHRFLLLRGIGGYAYGETHTPRALFFPAPAILGILVRAPGETLFGYDWVQPGSGLWIPLAALTAAVFLMLAFHMKTSARISRMIRFALVWIFVSALPAHFYFWTNDPGLFFSRTLYFGSIGVAILIAVLLGQTIPGAKPYGAAALAIAALLFAGLQHNISAWQVATQESKDWLAALRQAHPSLPPGATVYVEGKAPLQNRGVPFFAAGLPDSVLFDYSWREDIHVVTDADALIPGNAIVVKYDWSKKEFVR